MCRQLWGPGTTGVGGRELAWEKGQGPKKSLPFPGQGARGPEAGPSDAEVNGAGAPGPRPATRFPQRSYSHCYRAAFSTSVVHCSLAAETRERTHRTGSRFS